MSYFDLTFKNVINASAFCFLLGIGATFIKNDLKLPNFLNKALPLSILFLIGLKGGGPLQLQFSSSAYFFLILTSILVAWGFLHPFISFYLLRTSTSIDLSTAAAIAAAFGSVSVMTFVTGASFLESLNVKYQEYLIAVMALMEIPAIISGLLIGKIYGKNQSIEIGQVIKKALFNYPIGMILLGLVFGALLGRLGQTEITHGLHASFKPLMCLFLFGMGLRVGLHRQHFRFFSWQLNLFAIYMPVASGLFGLFVSYLLQLDVGTATMVSVLTASASYIAVPAAMRIALPEAKEAVYLPLSLGITFPFNIMIGIPLYFTLANLILL